VVSSLEPARIDDAAALISGTPGYVRGELAQLRAAAEADPETALGLFERGRPRAVLHGALAATGFHVFAVHARRSAAGRAAAGRLVDSLDARFPGARLAVRVETGPEHRWLRELLEQRGFGAHAPELHFVRDLRDYAPPPPADPFSYLEFAELGRARLTELVRRIRPEAERDPLELDAAELVEEWLFAAGAGDGEADTSGWHVACLDGEPAGVTIAQPRTDGGAVGIGLFLGLEAEHRGRGLGTVLHHHLLTSLRSAGAVVYEDSTRADNPAMQRVFARTGCELRGSSFLYVRPPTAAPARLAGFDGLVELLRARGFRPTVHDDSRRLTVAVRSGRMQAPVDVAWSGDPSTVTVACSPGVRVPETARGAIERAVCRVNDGLDVPGFAIGADPGSLRYRAVLPTGADGGLDTAALLRALRIAVATAVRSRPGWEAAVRSSERPSALAVPISAP
jgi:GNAT superfamily N-acetyltransferase